MIPQVKKQVPVKASFLCQPAQAEVHPGPRRHLFLGVSGTLFLEGLAC